MNQTVLEQLHTTEEVTIGLGAAILSFIALLKGMHLLCKSRCVLERTASGRDILRAALGTPTVTTSTSTSASTESKTAAD